MKKVIFISALAIAAAVSCTKSDIVDTKFNEAISFENYIGRDAMTKAAVTDNGNIDEVTIGLYGYYTGAKKWDAAGVANPAANLWSNDALAYAEAAGEKAAGWYTEEEKYWTNASDWYSFLAYAPMAADNNGVSVAGTAANDVNVTYTTPVADGKLTTSVDLLYAQVVNTNKVASVGLQFKHALSRVTVKAKAPGNTMGIQFDVKNVTLSGTFNTTGTLNLATAKAAATTDAADAGWSVVAETGKTQAAYVFYNDTKGATIEGGVATDALTETAVDYAGEDNYLMMIPTDFTGTLSVTYTTIYEGNESNTMTKELPIATNFKMGKAYAITLAFEPVLDVIKFNVTVDEWGTEDEVTATGGNNPEDFAVKQN